MDERSGASRTAVLVCQGRACANGRIAPGRFEDETAAVFLHPHERTVVDWVRDGAVPGDWRDRIEYELVRGCAEVVAPRTVAIDDAVRESPPRQLVILGAGLDGRIWRMPELAETDAFEVDHPSSQADKRARVGDRAPLAATLRLVPLDFARDALDVALGAAGHDAAVPTTWIWEGVVPYLRHREVEATVRSVAALSAAGSRLIVNYQTPALSARLGRAGMTVATRLAGKANPLTGEPHRSAWRPTAMRALLRQAGFIARRDDDLHLIAETLDAQATLRRSLENGRVLVADRG